MAGPLPLDPPPPLDRPPLLAAAAVAVFTFLCYLPGLRNGFVWDDDVVLLGNPWLHPPTLATLVFYAGHPFATLYMPTTAWLLAAVAAVSKGFGLSAQVPSAAVFHAASALAHAVTAALVLLILHPIPRDRRAALPGALLGALLFALHPIQVESVAFAAELDTPLCGVFSMAALLGFCRAATEPSAKRSAAIYAAATLALLLALTSKPTAVVVPILAGSLLLALPVQHRRPPATLLRRLALWLIGSIVISAMTARLQGTGLPPTPLASRLVVAAAGVGFYAARIIWPLSLGIDYARTPLAVGHDATTPALLLITAGLILLAALTWRKHRAVTAAILIFTVALLPNSGLVPFDFQLYSTNADRYPYLAMLGPALLLALLPCSLGALGVLGGLGAFSPGTRQDRQGLQERQEEQRRTSTPAALVAILLVALLVPLQQRQLATWRNEQTLFSHALAIQPDSWWCWGDLAHADLVAGQFSHAADEARRSVTLRPDSLIGWENLGLAERSQHHQAAALDAFAHGLTLAPGNPLARQNYLDARRQLIAATMP